MIITINQYETRAEKIKLTIIKYLFYEKKPIVTEVTIKKEVDCYNVNIEAVVRKLNESKKFPLISCIKNSYGVLTLVV